MGTRVASRPPDIGRRVACRLVVLLAALTTDIQLSGGRGGGAVKTLTGPPNSIVRGAPGRIYQTDSQGRVIADITAGRVKPVTPGQGFGPKRPPTPQELDWLNQAGG